MATNDYEKAFLKIDGSTDDVSCLIVDEHPSRYVVQLIDKIDEALLGEETTIAIVRSRYNKPSARSGVFVSLEGDKITIKVEPKRSTSLSHDESKLTSCQLPAMFRPRSEEGYYGCWKGAFIIKHGPDRLHIQVEEDQSIPKQTELMFSPIGSDSGAGAGRMYGDDGSVINASDVRSRRIRVRAITRDVLPSATPGTVTLVMDITRTLYRTA